LEQLDRDLTVQTVQLDEILAETKKKTIEVSERTEIQNEEVRKLKIVTEEIQNEKADTEKQKANALKLAETFSGKDISEVNS